MTRKEAKAQGLTRYTGKMCGLHPEQRGKRQTDGTCVGCRQTINAAYRHRHPDRAAATKRADNRRQALRNPKGVLSRKRTYRKRNKNKIADYDRAYRNQNPERLSVSRQTRRARARGAYGNFTESDLQRLRDEQRGICAAPFCKTLLAVSCSVDHKQPL